MSKNNPLSPDHDLPPDLQQAVKKALAATDDLCPPPCYDAAYWREEREALACLREAERQLLEWYFEEGLSERAIAEQLGCSHMTVHRRLRVAWSRFCQALGVEREFPGRECPKSPKRGKNRDENG